MQSILCTKNLGLYTLSIQVKLSQSSSLYLQQVTLITDFNVSAEFRATLAHTLYVENRLLVTDAIKIRANIKKAFVEVNSVYQSAVFTYLWKEEFVTSGS